MERAPTPLPLRADDPVVGAIRSRFLETYLAHVPREWLDSESGRDEVMHEIVGRYAHCATFTLPWLSRAIELPLGLVLEIGCGTGAKTAVLAQVAATVHACEPSEPHLRATEGRLACLGLDNVELVHGTAADLLDDAERRYGDGVDAIVLYAVLEHMTPAERDDVLRRGWALLRDGGILLVQETPNRLLPFDYHTTGLPFFGYLPDELALRYVDRSPYGHVPEAIRAFSDPIEGLYRAGRGASYHEFELALGDLDAFVDRIRCDSWAVEMLNLDPVHQEEVRLREWSAARGIELAGAFCRYWLALVAVKGASPSRLARPRMPVLADAAGAEIDVLGGELLLAPAGRAVVDLGGASELVVAVPADVDGSLEIVLGDRRVALDRAALAQVPGSRWNPARYVSLDVSGVDAVELRGAAAGDVRLPYLHVR